MLVVPNYLKESPIHGVGLYAERPIRKGDPVWSFTPGFDQLIPETLLPSLPPLAYDFLMKYGHPCRERPGFLLLEVDNARFANHSETPNCEAGVALRDIAADEEITIDYERLRDGYQLPE